MREWITHKEEGGGDDFLRRSDKSVLDNTKSSVTGAEPLCFQRRIVLLLASFFSLSLPTRRLG